MKKGFLYVLTLILVVSCLPFVLSGCGEVPVDYKFEKINTDFKKNSYSDSIFTKYSVSLTFSLKNITEETLDVKVIVSFGYMKNGSVSYKKKETWEALAFKPGEIRDFSSSASGQFTEVHSYKIEIFK